MLLLNPRRGFRIGTDAMQIFALGNQDLRIGQISGPPLARARTAGPQPDPQALAQRHPACTPLTRPSQHLIGIQKYCVAPPPVCARHSHPEQISPLKENYCEAQKGFCNPAPTRLSAPLTIPTTSAGSRGIWVSQPPLRPSHMPTGTP